MKSNDEYKVCSLEEAEAFSRKRKMNLNPYNLADAMRHQAQLCRTNQKIPNDLIADYLEQGGILIRQLAECLDEIEKNER